MADTKPEAEALLHTAIKTALRNHRLQNQVDEDGALYPLVDALTPDGADSVAVGEEEIALMADAVWWEVCAALSKPSVAPDDEASFKALAQCVHDCGGDDPDSQAVREFGYIAIEALRRRIAELRSDNAQLQYALEQSEMRYSEKEVALAACRDKTIEDACAALKAKQAMLIDVGCDGPVVNAFSSAMGVIRTLKTQEPTHG